MIVDGNTDWSPAEDDHVVVGVAIGPSSAGRSSPDPLTTGPVPVALPDQRAATAAWAAPTARAFLQTGVVLLAAALVGLLVFGVLRSVAGDRSGYEEADVDRSNGPSLDPGPGDPGGSGDLGSSKRGTAGLGQQRDDGDAAAPSDLDGSGTGTTGTTGGTRTAEIETGDTETDSPLWARPVEPSGPGAADPAAPVTVAERAGPITVVERFGPPTTANSRSGPSTTATVDRFTRSTTPGVDSTTTTSTRSTTTTAVTSTNPTTRPTTTTTRKSTTTRQPTTTVTPSTTIAPTTTRAPTTTTPLPSSLIAEPSGGSVAPWEAPLTLRANTVPGASEYCWTLSGTDRVTSRCRSASSYGHPGASRRPGPGPVSIRVEARAADGRVIMSEGISITLLAGDLIDEPTAGTTYELGDRLRLVANRVPGATRYCWNLSQGATGSGQLCQANRNRNLRPDTSVLAGFGAGPVTVEVVAERSGVVVGRQSAGVDFVDP